MKEEAHRKAYVEEKVNELFKQWLRKAVLWGAVIFLLLSGLDYISTPDNFRLFLYYRVTIALILVIISQLIERYYEKNMRFHKTLAYIAIFGSAVTIEFMILEHGGHASSYYVGLLLLGVCTIGFIPASFSFHLVASLLIYIIYLVPIVIFDTIADVKMFFTSNIFLIAALSSILLMRMLTERGLLNELGLKYDLEKYKDHLEGIVSESTGMLDSAHEELRESESKYQTLFKQMLNGFAYHRIEMDDSGNPIDYVYLEVNGAFEKLMGLRSEDVTGKRVTEVLPELKEDAFDWIGAFGKVALEGVPLTFERFFEPLGKWLSVSAYSPKKGFFATILDDVTERKKIDDALRNSEQRLSSFMDSATDSFILFDGHLRVTGVNVSASELFGGPNETIKGRHISELFPELDGTGRFDMIKTALKKSSRYDKYLDVLNTGNPFELDNFLLMSGSGLKYISLKVFRVGEGLGVIATDITERKRMEDQMYRDKQDWEDTFNAITDAITIHDNDFNIVHSNNAADKMLGLSDSKSNGKCYKYYHGTESPPENCPTCECLKNREPCISEMYEPNLNKYIEIRALPRFDRNNAVIGIIHVVRDITTRKTAEDQISRQFDRLQALRTIDMAITASLDLGHTLNVFLDQVTSQLRADAVDVLLYNRYSLKLEYAAGKGFGSDAIKYSRLKLGEGIAGKIAKDRKSMIIYDLQRKRDDYTRNLMVEEEGFVTYFGVPLIAKGNVLGVLEIYQRSIFEPDDDWIDFLGALAGQAAIAIDNASLFNDLKDSHDNLVMAYETTIEGWARALDYRDRETEGHSRRVSELTLQVAREMGVGEQELVHIHRGALLHDIGKIGVPDNILLKTDSLSDEEWIIMKKHPELARDLLFGIPFLRQALDIPYCHHERWDGSGYPRGIREKEIPVAARIFAVVDHWDAMTSNRPYRPAFPDNRVREEIRSLAGIFFDPEVVEVFLKMNIKSA